MDNKQINIEEYSKIAPQYYSDRIPPLLKKYLKTEHYVSILDCGCGDGSLLYALNKAGYLSAKSVLAVDLSLNRIELVKTISENIIGIVDNAEELKSVQDNSIDFFISTQVIEHADDKKIIEKIKQKVKSGGVVYLSTVFKRWYGWYFYRNQGRWVLDPTHLREYTEEKQLLDLFDPKVFTLLEHRKNLQFFPIIDFFTKRLKFKNRKLYDNKLMKLVRKIKVPIPGYYEWEIVFKKS
jgi:2-polyprenyl-3-methyl-5-hydroxy-6-metoxy-1,4-benzoquinol methylase